MNKRSRKTKKSVILIDKLSTFVITFGGILVIVAVLGILGFLTSVVVPLFQEAKVNSFTSYKLPLAAAKWLFTEVDEYQSLGIVLAGDGTLTAFHVPTGEKIFEEKLSAFGAEVTAFSRTLRGGYTALGLANGEIALGNISFNTSFLQEEEVERDRVSPYKNLKPGGSVIFEKGVLERTLEGQFRKVEVHVEFAPPVKLGTGEAPVILIDYRPLGDENEAVAGLKADGQLLLSKVRKKKNLLTGQSAMALDKWEIPYEPSQDLPSQLLLTSRGDQLYLAWKDGTLHRYDLRNLKNPIIAEKTNLIRQGASANEPRTLTQLKFMLGEQSLISTDSSGNVVAWFRVEKGPQARSRDGYELVPAHLLEKHRSAVSALAVSPRDKGLVTATSDGEVFLRHMTSERVLLRLLVPTGEVMALQIAPKTDGIFAVDRSLTAYIWGIYNPHPETTLKTIFGKVWYEGYPEPTYTWQSSSGTDDFEPKLSLVPLAFGTFKATLYSMLFAVPIAILAAVYTSEFLDKRLKTILKPGIEMMASLPSVVLGFLAALVLAPFVENWVLSVLCAFGLMPMILLLAGYLWQLLPQKIAFRFSGALQFVGIVTALLLAFGLSDNIGLFVEDKAFGGDFKAWLDGRVGTATPLWFIVLFPVSLPVVFLLRKKYLDPIIREKTVDASPFIVGLVELIGGLFVLMAAALVSYLGGGLLTLSGVDARGELVGTYVQRNTLVVGFAMGFAVIPIIYTLTEDALSSVPESLRAASLACGATRWQTALRVIIPTAASGIFSAVMVGLGRAVGETMIVVMAAGNTPVLDLNIFNGLRALSANIAVELPEAVKDSTLYRMLFLAALLLFAITFVVNTVAEIVRLRFRKRAYQL